MAETSKPTERETLSKPNRPLEPFRNESNRKKPVYVTVLNCMRNCMYPKAPNCSWPLEGRDLLTLAEKRKDLQTPYHQLHIQSP